VSPSFSLPLRKIESRTAKAIAFVGGFLLFTLLVAIVIGVINSNLFWGEANQYARIDIPGRAKVQLPSGATEATVAVALPGRGNETPELLLPPLQLSVTPIGEAGKVAINETLQGSVNANDKYDDTSRVVWTIHAPSAGEYLVHITGDMTGYGVNSQLWLGYQAGWVHGTDIWFLAAAIVAAFGVLSSGFYYFRKRRKERPATMPAGWQESGIPGADEAGGESVETAAQKMGKLQRRYEAGSVDEAEFEKKKNELESEFMSERGLR
jgi:hypothetical protein